MLRCSIYPFAVALVIASVSPVRSAEKNASELELKTERAIVFKDGYALIIKRGIASTDQAGEVFTDEVPDAAVLGSFWAVPEEGRLISMLAGWKETKESDDEQMPCTQSIEILLANKGKHAKVELHDKTLYSGVIQEVLIEKSDVPAAAAQWSPLDGSALSSTPPPKAKSVSSHVNRIAVTAPVGEHTLTTISGSSFVLRSDEGDVLLPVSQVRTILVKDMTTTIAKPRTTLRKTKRLTFKFEGAKKEQTVSIMYFRPGIRWIPTYRVSLSDKQEKKTATVSLQAELLNEAEDLDDVPVDLVVGVPNFRFRGTPSPLVLEATLRNALAEAAPNLMGNQGNAFSNAMYSQRSGEFRGNHAQANEAPQSVVELPSELTAGGAQDLFVYNLPKITLGKGDRAAVPIFTTEVPYRDVYTWDIHLTKQDNDAAPSGSAAKSPLTLAKNEVWHQILLTNTTNLPWTTGAAMIMERNQPLAQELLTYTPPKGEVRVPVTVSVDTRGSVTEKELSRELNGIQWDGVKYARIDKEIKLNLSNNKPIDVETEITLRVGGKVDTVSHDGDVTLSAFNAADWVQYNSHPAVNYSSSVVWRLKLKPGETFEPSVAYHYFTRH
jgi:hypothetical protein